MLIVYSEYGYDGYDYLVLMILVLVMVMVLTTAKVMVVVVIAIRFQPFAASRKTETAPFLPTFV